MATTDELLCELLKLPASERARAARVLLESLDDDEPDDPTAEAEWVAEIVRRLESIEDGSAMTHDLDEAVARVRARLRDMRQRRDGAEDRQ